MKLSDLATIALLGALLLTSITGCGSTAESIAEEDEGLIVVRRMETGDPRSIDPHKTGDVVSSRQAGLAYDTLLQYHYLTRPATLVPNLCTAMPMYDAAEMTYTFKLREDVYFHDDRCFHPDAQGKFYREEGEGSQDERGEGRQLVAADLVYSFKRLFALPDSGGEWVLAGYIKGLDSFRGQALNLVGAGPSEDIEKPWRDFLRTEPVEGLEAPDQFTFRVHLTQAYPQFLGAITLSYGAAVPFEAAEYYGKDYFRKPVGTGPYLLKSWRPNWELVWVRNPKFREEYFPTSDDEEDKIYRPLMGKRLPIADRIDYRIIKESQPAFLKFLKGEIDASGIDKDNFSSAVTPQATVTSKLEKLGITVNNWADPTLDFVVFNMTDPLVGMQDNSTERAVARERARAIRRAVALSIDREDYIRRYRNGRGQPALQLIPPGMPGNSPGFDMPSQRYDPPAARKILEEAGFILEGSGEGPWRALDPGTGKQVTVSILLRDNSEQGKDEARYYKTCGDKVGIQLIGEPLTFNEFLKRQDEGVGQAYDAGWVMDYPDAQNMMQLLYGPQRPPGLNAASYEDPEYDRLYEEMAVLDDTKPEQFDRKMELIGRMHQILDRDVPWVLFNFRQTYALYNPWFMEPKPNEFAYTYGKYWYSDSAARVEAIRERADMSIWPALVLGLVLVVPTGFMVRRIVKQSR
jgi:oligopeptide transport system substrate-binding protein